MEQITNPAVTEGVNIFVNIFITLVAFATAVSFVDILKAKKSDKG